MSLKTYREKARLGQKEFAALIGVTPSAVCMYEAGTRMPPIPRVQKIIAVLKAYKVKCSVNDLFPPAG